MWGTIVDYLGTVRFYLMLAPTNHKEVPHVIFLPNRVAQRINLPVGSLILATNFVASIVNKSNLSCVVSVAHISKGVRPESFPQI